MKPCFTWRNWYTEEYWKCNLFHQNPRFSCANLHHGPTIHHDQLLALSIKIMFGNQIPGKKIYAFHKVVENLGLTIVNPRGFGRMDELPHFEILTCTDLQTKTGFSAIQILNKESLFQGFLTCYQKCSKSLEAIRIYRCYMYACIHAYKTWVNKK